MIFLAKATYCAIVLYLLLLPLILDRLDGAALPGFSVLVALVVRVAAVQYIQPEVLEIRREQEAGGRGGLVGKENLGRVVRRQLTENN